MNVTIIQEFQKLLIKFYSTSVWVKLKVKEFHFSKKRKEKKLKNSRRFSSISYSVHYSYTVQFHCPRIPGPSHQFPIYYTSVYVICMVQLCYEFQNILFNIIIHSTTLFNHPRIPKHLINFSSFPLLYGAKSQKNLKNILVQSKKYI